MLANGFRYLVDPRVVDGTAWITGADETGKHVVGAGGRPGLHPDGTIEAAEVRDGDPSPDGGQGPLVSARGIEIGHIFQLGRKYIDTFSADVLGEDGKPVRLTMGSYGVGVSRLVAVIAEQHHDEPGLRWPSSVSPFDARRHRQQKDPEARTGAGELAADLDRLGLEVLLDDRTASPGVKFKDAELLGVPWIVVVGRGWADGVVELRNRFNRRAGRSPPAPRWPRSPRRWPSRCPEPGHNECRPGRSSPVTRCRPECNSHRPPAVPQLPPAAATAHSVSAVTPNARSSSVPACSITARQATAQSSSIRTASLAASAGVLTGNGSW